MEINKALHTYLSKEYLELNKLLSKKKQENLFYDLGEDELRKLF